MIESSDFTQNTPFGSLSPDEKKPLSAGGSTCLAYCVRLAGRLLFMKQLRPEHVLDERYHELLTKEFSVGFTLEHPNIVRYIARGADENGPYLLLEYVDGWTLSRFMDENPDWFSNEAHLNAFTRQLFDALAYLHDHQVLHSDIKPDNLLITRIGHVLKLVDLGFCYTDSFTDTSGHTEGYAAPEQKESDAPFDQRSDIYSAGVVMKYILARCPRHPRTYDKLARWLTQDEPSERPQSAVEVLRWLESQSSRRKSIRYAAALSLALAIVVVMGTLWLRQGHAPEPVATGATPVEEAEVQQRDTTPSTDTLRTVTAVSDSEKRREVVPSEPKESPRQSESQPASITPVVVTPTPSVAPPTEMQTQASPSPKVQGEDVQVDFKLELRKGLKEILDKEFYPLPTTYTDADFRLTQRRYSVAVAKAQEFVNSFTTTQEGVTADDIQMAGRMEFEGLSGPYYSWLSKMEEYVRKGDNSPLPSHTREDI